MIPSQASHSRQGIIYYSQARGMTPLPRSAFRPIRSVGSLPSSILHRTRRVHSLPQSPSRYDRYAPSLNVRPYTMGIPPLHPSAASERVREIPAPPPLLLYHSDSPTLEPRSRRSAQTDRTSPKQHARHPHSCSRKTYPNTACTLLFAANGQYISPPCRH